MTDVGRRQFLATTVAALASVAFSGTALGSDEAFEQRGPRGAYEVEGGFWHAWTGEHLYEEMRCWVGGIKDHHDLAIEHMRAKVREKYSHTKAELIEEFEAKIEPKRRWTVGHAVDPEAHPWSSCPAASYVGTCLGIADLIETGDAFLSEEATVWRERARVEHERHLHSLDVNFAFGDRRVDAGSLFLDKYGDICVR